MSRGFDCRNSKGFGRWIHSRLQAVCIEAKAPPIRSIHKTARLVVGLLDANEAALSLGAQLVYKPSLF